MKIEICDVGPRDGFQFEDTPIPTDLKLDVITALADAGLRVPDALLSLSPERLDAGRDGFGEEAVFKTAIGTHGGGAWLVDLDEPGGVGDDVAAVLVLYHADQPLLAVPQLGGVVLFLGGLLHALQRPFRELAGRVDDAGLKRVHVVVVHAVVAGDCDLGYLCHTPLYVGGDNKCFP